MPVDGIETVSRHFGSMGQRLPASPHNAVAREQIKSANGGVARGDGGSDTDDNMITPCVGCHGKIHGVVWRNNHKMLTRDGLRRAKARGKSGGRPKIDKATEAAIHDALRRGDAGMHKIATGFGVGTGTVQRIKAGMAGQR
jgi:hypothetical protein